MFSAVTVADLIGRRVLLDSAPRRNEVLIDFHSVWRDHACYVWPRQLKQFISRPRHYHIVCHSNNLICFNTIRNIYSSTTINTTSAPEGKLFSHRKWSVLVEEGHDEDWSDGEHDNRKKEHEAPEVDVKVLSSQLDDLQYAAQDWGADGDCQ